MNLEDLTLGQIKEINKLFNSSNVKKINGEIKIVVLIHGWIGVGRVYSSENEYTVKNTHVIREWGTKKGLGELISGPLPQTVLDFYGEISFLPTAIIFMMKVNQEAWVKHV